MSKNRPRAFLIGVACITTIAGCTQSQGVQTIDSPCDYAPELELSVVILQDSHTGFLCNRGEEELQLTELIFGARSTPTPSGVYYITEINKLDAPITVGSVSGPPSALWGSDIIIPLKFAPDSDPGSVPFSFHGNRTPKDPEAVAQSTNGGIGVDPNQLSSLADALERSFKYDTIEVILAGNAEEIRYLANSAWR